jgi:hypothetical protein
MRAMKKLSLFVLLVAATPLVNCQQSSKSSTTPGPDDGTFIQNTYRGDFFGFSYALPGEWYKSTVTPATLPSGAFYLFIGDRNTGQPLLNRVMVIADPKSENRPGASTQQYVSAFIRAQVRNENAEVIPEPSSFAAGENNFHRADYKSVQNGITVYSSMVCTERNNYWISWNFVAPSMRNFDDAMDTLKNVSFDRPSPR